MLILKRDAGGADGKDVVVITTRDGVRVVVRLLETDGRFARIGFEAPRDVTIHRGEVQDRVDLGEVRRGR